MPTLEEVIIEKRPNLSPSSVKTYKSILTSLHRAVYPESTEIKISDFNNSQKIIKHLQDTPFSKRKTILAALVVITGDADYNKLMMCDQKEYSKNQLEQKKDGKFADMLPYTEVEEVLKKYAAEAKPLIKREHRNMSDLQKIQNFIILALTTGIYHEPRRSSDWIMKVRDYDVENHNYLDMKRKVFVFNHFKTVKKMGTQTIPIDPALFKILKKWIEINGNDYLLFNAKGNPVQASELTHRLNGIFGKNISTSMLRHIYLTHRFGNINLKELTNVADAMGQTNIATTIGYVKNK
jgi:integrase